MAQPERTKKPSEEVKTSAGTRQRYVEGMLLVKSSKHRNCGRHTVRRVSLAERNVGQDRRITFRGMGDFTEALSPQEEHTHPHTH
jgi:hypothetical protein